MCQPIRQQYLILAQATSLVEPEDRLAIPVPMALSRGDQVHTLHLHCHEHVSVTVDDKVHTVIERFAERHGKLFSYLYEEICQLGEQMPQQA